MYSDHLLEFIGALPVKLLIHLKTLHDYVIEWTALIISPHSIELNGSEQRKLNS